MNDHGKGILGRMDATGEEIADAMGFAFRQAAREHKRAGNPLPTWDWENNRVVMVPPEEIQVPDEEEMDVEVRDEAAEPRNGPAE